MSSLPSLRTSLDRRRRRRLNDRPPEPPPGWVTGPPDFVGLGVQKAGTSWWYELVVDHPDVERPPQAHKELRFFNRFAVDPFTSSDIDRYHGLFPRPPGARTGEWTPSYLADFWVPSLLRRAAPDARLLVILREPVDRYVSGLTEFAKRHDTIGIGERRNAFQRGCYASQLERLFAVFPPDQVLVLLYEACRDDPAPELARTYEFLGLGSDHVPDGLDRPVHATTAAKVHVDDDTLSVLATAYSSEVARLGQICPGLDLARWERTTRPAQPGE